MTVQKSDGRQKSGGKASRNGRSAELSKAPSDGQKNGNSKASRDGRSAELSAAADDSCRLQRIVTRLRLVTAPSRQNIILALENGERNVAAICQTLNNPSQPAVSHQLSLLRHGQLIESSRRGRNVFYSLTESGQAVARAFNTLGKIDMSFNRIGWKRPNGSTSRQSAKTKAGVPSRKGTESS